MVPPPSSSKTRAPREIGVLKSKTHRYLRGRALVRQPPRSSKRRGAAFMITKKIARRFHRGASGGGSDSLTEEIE